MNFYEFMNKKQPNFPDAKSIPQAPLHNIGTDEKVLNKWVEIDGPIHMSMDLIIKNR